MDIPKGKLLVIGGAIDKGIDEDEPPEGDKESPSNFFELGILKRFMDELKGNTIPRKSIDKRVEIITTASEVPEEVGERYIDAFKRLGYKNIGILPTTDRKDVTKKVYINRIARANAVLFTGGNQLRLTSIFGGSDILKLIIERYRNENFLIAGTSAGAMAMSNPMIYHGHSAKALLKGEVKLTKGFGLIDDVIIDSHFVKRGRFGRLFQAVASNPSSIGIGLGEDTGLLITEGDYMEAIGSGLVIIVDGKNIQHNNIASIADGEPISVENLSVHVLAQGHSYLLSERRYIREEEGKN